MCYLFNKINEKLLKHHANVPFRKLENLGAVIIARFEYFWQRITSNNC